MIKEILVNVKQILEENFLTGEVTYGDQEAFSIAVQQVLVPGPGRIYDPYKMSLACFQNSEAGGFYGTNLITFHTEAPVGTEWQFFTLDGKKLGFRLRKVSYRAEYNEANFLIYNEEIAAYMYGGDSRIDHMCLYVPRKYITSDEQTLEDVIKNAEKIYNNKNFEYLEGFDTNANNVLGLVAKSQPGYDGADIFTSCTSSDFYCMRNHTKLHYFSSWYKLITGKFYKEDELFSAKIDKLTLTDPEKQTFYFGKILDERPAAIDENAVESMKQYTDHDASISARDLIYGTSLSARWLMPGYSETEGLLFKNGMKIFLYLKNSGSRKIANQKILFTVKADEEGTTEEYTLHQVMCSAEEIHGPYGIARTSLLQCFLIPEHPGGTAEGRPYDTAYDAGMLFIEPMYNSIPANKISDFIEGLDEPSDPKLWGQYPLAPIRFYSTYTADTTDSTQRKVYGATYEPKYISFTFTGWCNPKNNSSYTNFDTIYHPSFPDAGCDITSKEVWAKIMRFSKPTTSPTIPGGGFLGGDGGDGTGDTSSENIEIPTIHGFTTGGSGALVFWDIGNQKLDGIKNWIADTSLIDKYKISEKANTICSLKRFMYPFTPQNEGPSQPIFGFDGKPFLDSDGSSFTGKNIDQQYQHNTIGEFTIQRFFDSFLDYDPYTKIKLYLPFAGVINLSPSDVIGRKITIDSGIDWISGNIVYNILVEGEYSKSVLYTATGNCTADLPLTATDFSGRCSALLSAGVVAAGSMATAATASLASPLLALGASAVAGYKALEAGKVDIQRVSGNNISNSGGLSPMTCFLLIERPVVALPGDAATFASHYGFAASTAGKLIDFSGFTQCSDVHLENLSCLEEEKSELEQLLKSGVIL